MTTIFTSDARPSDRLPRGARTPASRAGRAFHRAAQGDARGVTPKALESVELPLLVDEHVDDDVDEVHQDPVGDAAALDVLRLAAALVEQPLFDRVGDRKCLASRRSVTDDEVVGEMAEAPQIENENVFGFLVASGVDDLLQYGFQRAASSAYNLWR
jgi:hypothetical protein